MESYDIALGHAALGAVQPLVAALRDPTVRDSIIAHGGYGLSHAGGIKPGHG